MKKSEILPVNAVIMKEEDTSELSGSVVIGPIDASSTTGEENKGLERWVKRSQRGEIGWVIGVFVAGLVSVSRF